MEGCKSTYFYRGLKPSPKVKSIATSMGLASRKRTYTSIPFKNTPSLQKSRERKLEVRVVHRIVNYTIGLDYSTARGRHR